MPGLLPAAVYGLQVPCGDLIVPASDDPSPISFRITMAAIDPTAAPEFAGGNVDAPVRATLKLIREPLADSDSDYEEDDEDDYLHNMLNGGRSGDDEDDESSSSDDDEKNGGPSDPAKSKKARREAAIEKLREALEKEDSDDEMEDGDDKPNGLSPRVKKGKGKLVNGATMDEDSSDEEDDYEEFVLCTLDPEKHYQQPLDITVGEHEQVFFKVSGTHAIYLTGNYVVPIDDSHRHGDSDSDDDEDEDYEIDADGIYGDDEESDELDDIADPRITELESEDGNEAAPTLIKREAADKKGKNKRPAEDPEPASLDDIMAKSLKPEVPAVNGEQKLSKKQLKKLKNNAGKAVDATVPATTNGVKADEKALKDAKSESPEVKDKKVKFAKNLEQGPSGTAAPSTAEKEKKADIKKDAEKLKATLGVKTVQGVKIDDKKLGSGAACKNGNKVSMRYIGKLENGKQFDANKKGKPFSFQLGKGEVIKGWDIGVAGMCIGGERRITIPAHLAYGSKSMPDIPANSTLIFEVKLLEIH